LTDKLKICSKKGYPKNVIHKNIPKLKDHIEKVTLPESDIENGHLAFVIDEGVAIISQFPEFLIKNNCFSLLASRHHGDQRVPAIWINSRK